MGYPMTWSRFIKRNYLQEGDYRDIPFEHQPGVNLGELNKYNQEKFAMEMHPHYVERLKRYEDRMSLLLGDLRRLEKDTMDENYICAKISALLDIDRDDVAAVLRAYLELV